MQHNQSGSAAAQAFLLMRSKRNNLARKLGKKQMKQLEKLGERSEKKKLKMEKLKLKEMMRNKKDAKELVKGVGHLELEKDEVMEEVGEGKREERGTRVPDFEGFRERGGMVDE